MKHKDIPRQKERLLREKKMRNRTHYFKEKGWWRVWKNFYARYKTKLLTPKDVEDLEMEKDSP